MRTLSLHRTGAGLTSRVQIFIGFIDSGLHHDLILLLQDETEPVTPSQTILYKLLDSHLSSSSRPNVSPSPHIFLVDSFKDYSRYALISLRSGQDDARLPKVFEALVLVCEGLCSMGLASQGRRDKGKGKQVDVGGDEEVVRSMKREGDGIVKPLIGTCFVIHPGIQANGPRLFRSATVNDSATDPIKDQPSVYWEYATPC